MELTNDRFTAQWQIKNRQNICAKIQYIKHMLYGHDVCLSVSK